MLENIYNKAIMDKIPIMQSDGLEYLLKIIKENNITRILEIGSAVGYSAIRMALVNENIKVTTIERDINRYNEAVNNITLMSLSDRITIINKDASDVEITGLYDLIFIDASKGHNIEFFQKFSKNLDKYGIIVCDNLSFHGLVENEELIQTKNQRGLVRKIKEFISFLDNNSDFITKYVSVGDKISISVRKEDSNE